MRLDLRRGKTEEDLDPGGEGVDGQVGWVAELEPSRAGLQPIGPGTRRMPVRYYLIAVLFILFDIEVVFFLPWAVVFRQLAFSLSFFNPSK